MKKVIFTIEGRRFEIELENAFADFVEENLKEQEIAQDRNNEASQFIKAYLNILKENYEATKHIKTILNKLESSN
jgi:hypothetical protein